MFLVGVVAGCVRWGSNDMLAHAEACTWFASPLLAVGLWALMSFSLDGIQVEQSSLCECMSHLQLREAMLPAVLKMKSPSSLLSALLSHVHVVYLHATNLPSEGNGDSLTCRHATRCTSALSFLGCRSEPSR